MGSSETLCLRCNEFESNIKLGFSQLRNDEDLFDVTLACGSKHIKAHKVILSACSSFFRSLIKSIPHQHPLLYLRGIDFNHLESVLCFMYNGEVRIKPHELDQFLSIAQELKVYGLMQDQSPQSSKNVNKIEPMPLKRSLPTTDDTPALEVKRESSSPLHLQNKRVLIENTISTPNTGADEDSLIEDITSIGSNTMMGEPSNVDYLESDNDQDAYDFSFQSEAIENLNQETDPLALRYVSDVLDAEILKYVSDRDANKMYSCLKCSYTSLCKRNLKRHVKARHFDTKVFSCDKCSRMYKTREALSKHVMRFHKSEPNYFRTTAS
ncbi:uncharacterized protein [Lepeophtheirus salmonis]|uniref:uncharacterized protein isoform X1 n=1 Tax=Lepeophtheirus salmonis TaxID=72036 RepID=UPI001AE11D4A|nr:protein tramtrack, beta isoform-like isoform X1 [Lepeophtheirus salmonis]XP_040580958.1 protein tramtrack, beta isoform-like isoform X1 [Lepeophtheirus salmonis]